MNQTAARRLAALLCAAVLSWEALANGKLAPTGGQQVPANEDEAKAVETARQAISRKLYVAVESLPVLSIEQRSWPNTGLGCATADDATIRIPRNGYAVVLATPVGPRRVHVAGRSARLCDPANTAAGTVQPTSTLPYNLNAMVEHARADLARRLDTPVSTIRLVSFNSAEWLDSTMECAVPYERTQRKRISGYRLQLSHGDRTYMYHTDMTRTRACPASVVSR
jgi:hypothetical protein